MKRDLVGENKRAFFIDERGSATVEAAVVIPFFLLILALIIHLSFYLYDCVVLERACNMAALRGSRMLWEENDLRFQKTEEGIEDILRGGLLGMCEAEQDIKVGHNHVSVSLSAQYKWWKFMACEEKSIINPVQFVRDCRKAEGVVNLYE